ncbi:MAG: GntR family transcriptional regulator [Gammaproteobacteria bacterium]|nr:GntR family transcriptional regulator [Gammaproteobacteria bacterium]
MLTTGKGSIPLYLQIIELLISKISKAEWLPGDIIPSEINLAKELDVSQGTVRKAITELVENNVLTRKQGLGTFVSNHNIDRALFHFFHITDNDGHKVLPDSQVLNCRRKKATKSEAHKLKLKPGDEVIKIDRVRNLSSKPTIVETIILPEVPFTRLGKEDGCDLPNMLYELYEKQFGITIHSAEEQIRAVRAQKQQAKILDIDEGSPLLMIERVALTLDRRPVELRTSYCSTTKHYYQNTLL